MPSLRPEKLLPPGQLPPRRRLPPAASPRSRSRLQPLPAPPSWALRALSGSDQMVLAPVPPPVPPAPRRRLPRGREPEGRFPSPRPGGSRSRSCALTGLVNLRLWIKGESQLPPAGGTQQPAPRGKGANASGWCEAVGERDSNASGSQSHSSRGLAVLEVPSCCPAERKAAPTGPRYPQTSLKRAERWYLRTKQSPSSRLGQGFTFSHARVMPGTLS